MLVSLLRTLMTSPGVNGENPAMLRRGDQMVEMVDALFIRSAQPQRGSVVFCRLVGMLEHTGICIGDDRIVHLDGSGLVEEVGPSEFMSRIDGANPSLTVYCSCDVLGVPIGRKEFAERAERRLGQARQYNLLVDNCHSFTSECVTGGSDILDGSFLCLETRLRFQHGHDQWRATCWFR